jgi:hypothetical protein
MIRWESFGRGFDGCLLSRVLSTAVVALCGCGGVVASAREHSSEASTVDQSSTLECDDAGSCLVGGSGVAPTEGSGSIPSPAAPSVGVLCSLNTGPVTPNQDAGGPVLQCPMGDVCTNVNGQWTCCTVESSGAANCLPFWPDGGRPL